MRKLFLLLVLIFVFVSSSIADDFFDSYAGIDHAWDGQKPITNQEFEDAINVLQKKQKQKEAKARKKKVRKISGGGTSLHSSLDPMSEISEQDKLISRDGEGQLLNVPVNMVIGDKILDTGFYNVFGEKNKEDGRLYLSFYQSGTFCGKVPAYETDNDYDAEAINFVKILPYSEHFVKIAFGSLKFNAYAYVQIYERDFP